MHLALHLALRLASPDRHDHLPAPLQILVGAAVGCAQVGDDRGEHRRAAGCAVRVVELGGVGPELDQQRAIVDVRHQTPQR